MATNGEKRADTSKKMLRRPRFAAAEPNFATVLVGPAKERFVVHEKLLTYHSEFFRAALTGRFKEATNKTVELHDTEPETFECFVHWLYHQRFPDADKGDDEELANIWGTKEKERTLTWSLIKMYVLADHYAIPQLQTEALDGLHYHMKRWDTQLPTNKVVSYAFENLANSSPLSRYLVDLMVYFNEVTTEGRSWVTVGAAEEWPTHFLFAFAHRASQVLGDIRWKDKKLKDFDLKLCDYHKHETAEEREKCEKR